MFQKIKALRLFALLLTPLALAACEDEFSSLPGGGSPHQEIVCKNSYGSGFYIAPNLVLTAAHVLPYKKCKIEMGEDSGKLVWKDTKRDIAVVYVKGKKSAFYPFQCDLPKEGSYVKLNSGKAIKKGRILSHNPDIVGNYFQTDISVRYGESGSPLFHEDAVIGVLNFTNFDDGTLSYYRPIGDFCSKLNSLKKKYAGK
ncbi:serine protease [Alphaproteobacteria bacterium]|jgi:S1-C subfamily serine protease|nr:serine protease [Alphaproteobacteria bacterium]